MALLQTLVAALTFLTLGLFGHQASAQQCRAWSKATDIAEIENDAIDESSGLAASRQEPDLLWTHNDSGDSARIFGLHADGAHVAEVRLTGGAAAVDWEDMASGPCEPDSDKTCLYIGDFGDNLRERSQVAIYKIAEPKLPDQRPARLTIKEVEAIWFTYPAGPRDAEALMVHPKTAEIFVIEKTPSAANSVYRIPNRAAPSDKPVEADVYGRLTVGRLPGLGTSITAADISPDGAEFTVRTYLMLYTFCIEDDLQGALKTKPLIGRPPVMVQSEALTYDPGGEALWLTSEGQPAPLILMERDESP